MQMRHIVTPAERLADIRRRARLGQREMAALLGVCYRWERQAEAGERKVPPRILDLIDSWNPDEIGRPVPTVTWTRGNPFKARRKR